MPVTTRKTNADTHPGAILMVPARKPPRTREDLLAEYEQTVEANAKEAQEKEDNAYKLAAVERDMARREAQARVRRDATSVESNVLSALHEEPEIAQGELIVSESVSKSSNAAFLSLEGGRVGHNPVPYANSDSDSDESIAPLPAAGRRSRKNPAPQKSKGKQKAPDSVAGSESCVHYFN